MKPEDLPVKKICFLADGVTQVQLERLQKLRHADSISSLIRMLTNEEYLSNEADIIERGYLFPAAPKEDST